MLSKMIQDVFADTASSVCIQVRRFIFSWYLQCNHAVSSKTCRSCKKRVVHAKNIQKF